MMSTTTHILFNSPALHSLKRDQLVKLCKIHAVKASGKNVDLIDRLKKHAATLPRDTPLSVATRSEGPDDTGSDYDGVRSEDHDETVASRSSVAYQSRPSEQWDIVMESIQEVEESSSQNTLSSVRTLSSGNTHSTGEFGSGSSKVASVSSSLKALATSLGLKRNTSKSKSAAASVPPHEQSRTDAARPTDELTKNAIPYSSIPETDPSALPKTDHFTFSDPEPIPGHALRPGAPAPANARLSIGTTAAPGTTTTIRLVSASYVPRPEHPSTPNLKPFATSFDLVVGSPSATTPMHVWPREDHTASIHPPLPAPFPLVFDKKQVDGNVEMPGAMPFPSGTIAQEPSASSDVQTPPRELSKPSAPFVFGSPHHRLSNQQFRTAAATVLGEMNKRLVDQGAEPLSFVFDQAGIRNESATSNAGDASISPATGENKQMTDEHDPAKKDTIATQYAARRDALDGLGHGEKKRKSSIALKNKGRPSTSKAAETRVISGGRRKMAIPGGFGDDDDDDEEDRRLSKKPRFEKNEAEQAKAKRVSIVAPATEEGESALEEEKKRLREKEAIRKKLEMNKARRRSSMGRTSVGGVKAPPITQKRGLTSRFGFLSSAKSMVQSVWNRGVATTTSAKSTMSATAPAVVSGIPKSTKRIAKPPIAMAPPPPKPVAPVSTLTSSIGSKGPSLMGRIAPGRLLKPTSAAAANSVVSTPASSSRSRSPIPSSFTRPPSIAASTRSSVAGTASKTSSVAGSRSGMGLRSKIGSRSGSIARASSIGTRSSVVAGSRVSSLGTRGSLASATTGGIADAENGRPSTAGRTSSGFKISSSSSSSRLLAPTASSLARASSQGGAQSNDPANRRPGTVRSQNGEKGKDTSSGVEAVEGNGRVAALAPITNRPLSASNERPQLPRERKGQVFNKPRVNPSGIPAAATVTTGNNFATVETITNPAIPSNTLATVETISKPSIDRPVGLKPKQPSGRKPRISRSRVIARLASQRAASGSSLGGAKAVSGESVTGRTRSSLGTTAAKRQSIAGGKSARGSEIMMSAKKRARQSEYARRKSRNVLPGVEGVAMVIEN